MVISDHNNLFTKIKYDINNKYTVLVTMIDTKVGTEERNIFTVRFNTAITESCSSYNDI